MASFEIPEGPSVVTLSAGADPKAPRTGSAVFTVNNVSALSVTGRLSVQVAGQSKAEWFTIDGERERNIVPGKSETATIKVNVPPGVTAGDYAFRLRVVAVNDTDNDKAEGPPTTVHVESASVPTTKIPSWVWIVVGLVVIAILGVGGYFAFGRTGPKPTPTPTITPTPTPAPSPQPTPVATDAEVPDLSHKTLNDAKALTADFVLSPSPGPVTGQLPNTILTQSPPAHQRQQKGFPIAVTFDPGVAVPSLVGLTTDDAVRALGPLGLHVQSSTSRCENSGVAGQIVAQNPPEKQQVAGNSGVDVTVRILGGVGSGNGKFGTILLRCGFVYRGMLRADIQPRIFRRPISITPAHP